MPEKPSNLVGVSEASYTRPLSYGLRRSFHNLGLLVDIPAQLAINLQKRTGDLQCAFLSPIDYARHGGDYCIVPGVAASSSTGSETIQLFINRDVADIRTIAVDIRVTSEIILAKIILAEKFPNRETSKESLQLIPMMPNRAEMLRKADAALVVNFHPVESSDDDTFALDLVDEWNDMTGLPYVHGIWVGYDEEGLLDLAKKLVRSKDEGIAHLDQVALTLAAERHVSAQFAAQYLSTFSYELDEQDQEALVEFMKYAYFHGILADVPDLNFFELDPPQSPSVN